MQIPSSIKISDSSSIDRIAIVVPVYNEAKRFQKEYWTKITMISGIDLIFVDDGSTDSTREMLLEFCSQNQNCISLILDKNMGKAEAIRSGFKYVFKNQSADTKWCGFLDADSAISSNEVYRILNLIAVNSRSGSSEIRSYDSVWAARVALSGRDISRKASRHYLSRIILTLLGFFIKPMPYDSQCGFKVFLLSDFTKAIFQEPFRTRWLFDIEIFLRMQRSTQNSIQIWEEPLQDWREIPGSKIDIKSYPMLAIEIIKILRMRMGNLNGN